MSTETYTIDEAAQILDCSSETAVERIVAGDIPGVKFGRSWIVPRAAFSTRLNELALQEAQERRKARDAGKVAGKAIKNAQGAAKKPGRVARTPPALPAPGQA